MSELVSGTKSRLVLAKNLIEDKYFALKQLQNLDEQSLKVFTNEYT